METDYQKYFTYFTFILQKPSLKFTKSVYTVYAVVKCPSFWEKIL